MTPSTPLSEKQLRQKKLLLILAVVLIVTGASVLLFLDRMPLVLRLVMGFIDLIAGFTLLVFRRQNYSK